MPANGVLGRGVLVLAAVLGLGSQASAQQDRSRNPAGAISAEDLLNRLDTNRDGLLDRDELGRLPQAGRGQLAFDELDIDGSGTLDRDEIELGLRLARDYAAPPRDAANRPRPSYPDPVLHADLPYARRDAAPARLVSLDVYTPRPNRSKPGAPVPANQPATDPPVTDSTTDPAPTTTSTASAPAGPAAQTPPAGLPVVVMIHGGGWRMGDKANRSVGMEKARFFCAAGCVYVSINYRLSPAVRHPAHVEDVAEAVAWVHRQIGRFGGDPERIFLMGHSAGAHLAALVSTDQRRLARHDKPLSVVRGVILLDGAGYDLERQIPVARGSRLYGGMFEAAFGTDPKVWKDASPITHVMPDAGIPPFLILYCAERPAARDQSDALARKLNAAGSPSRSLGIRGKTHASINGDIGTAGDAVTSEIVGFLRGNGAEVRWPAALGPEPGSDSRSGAAPGPSTRPAGR